MGSNKSQYNFELLFSGNFKALDCVSPFVNLWKKMLHVKMKFVNV